MSDTPEEIRAQSINMAIAAGADKPEDIIRMANEIENEALTSPEDVDAWAQTDPLNTWAEEQRAENKELIDTINTGARKLLINLMGVQEPTDDDLDEALDVLWRFGVKEALIRQVIEAANPDSFTADSYFSDDEEQGR